MAFDPFNFGMTLAGVGGAAAGALMPGPWTPFAVGAGLSLAGQGLTAAGTSSRMLGPSDADIARADVTARAARGADIERQSRRANQIAASRAGQAGLGGSGLAARAAGDVASARGQAMNSLEADLAHQRLAAVSQRRYVPELNGLGIAGRAVSMLSSPIAMFGAASLARDGFGGAPAGAGGVGAPAGGGPYPYTRPGSINGEGGSFGQAARGLSAGGPEIVPSVPPAARPVFDPLSTMLPTPTTGSAPTGAVPWWMRDQVGMTPLDGFYGADFR